MCTTRESCISTARSKATKSTRSAVVKKSFCVVSQDQIVPEEFTTYFKSVIAFGTVRLMEDGVEKTEALRALAERYSPEQMAAGEREIAASIAHTAMIEFTIEHLTGKEATELAKRRNT